MSTFSISLRQHLRQFPQAFLTWPSLPEWLWCGGASLMYLAMVLPLGFLTGFLRPEVMAGSEWKLVGVAGWLAVKPCLFEEAFFRVLLLPHRSLSLGKRPVFIISGVSLTVFVVAHPLNGLWLKPAAFQVFSSPVFLTLAALLGLTCTVLYRKTGSVWPCVVLHWVTVVMWILFLGGRNLLLGLRP
ncbi:MAG: CPBP family intramembrane metalloprotease [Blastocatellia bacterium]|nr:CPBP family intramembrane metalloprotease [Blastocatellia bacterium]